MLGGAFVATLERAETHEASLAAAAVAPRPNEPEAQTLAPSKCGVAPRPLGPLCEKFEEARLEAGSPADGDTSAVPAGESGTWQKAPWLRAARGKIWFLIATVPDPELTRLSLYFDRAMDSIQQAAESLGFYLDRHWLPWAEDAAGGGANFTGDEPRMLLFRKPGGAGEFLVVFLVGESPVSGIRQRTFRGLQMMIWAGAIGFIVMGIPVAVTIFQMEKDEILRRLTRGKEEPGALRLVKRLAIVGALPVLAMIGSYFPGIGRYLTTVIEPALKAL